MQVSKVKRLKELEADAARKKTADSKTGPPERMYAELSLQNEVIKEALAKK